MIICISYNVAICVYSIIPLYNCSNIALHYCSNGLWQASISCWSIFTILLLLQLSFVGGNDFQPFCLESVYAADDGLRGELPIEFLVEPSLEVEKEQYHLSRFQPCISAGNSGGGKLQLLFCRINLQTTTQTCIGYEWYQPLCSRKWPIHTVNLTQCGGRI